MRVEPYQAKALADVFLTEFFQINAKALPVWKLSVVLSLASEVGISLEAMANVANNQEGGPAFRNGQGLGVILRLAGARSA